MTQTPTIRLRRFERSVAAMPASVWLVRDLIEGRLSNWKAPQALIDDALLVISELCTNAITAAPGDLVTVRIDREPSGVLLAMWDPSPALPVSRRMVEPAALDLDPARFDDNGGHGLTIVSTLAHQYGHKPTAPTGKWVWARLLVRPSGSTTS